jgi:putative transposase
VRRRICPRPICREIVFLLVREMAAAGARIKVPVAMACGVLKLSRQAYYKWLKEPVSKRAGLRRCALDRRAV